MQRVALEKLSGLFSFALFSELLEQLLSALLAEFLLAPYFFLYKLLIMDALPTESANAERCLASRWCPQRAVAVIRFRRHIV